MHNGEASTKPFRAGRYIQQTTGYRAFIPTPLPPDPPLSLQGELAAGNGHRILEYLYQHPILSVSDVREWIGATYPAANNLVARLQQLGILHEMTGQTRNRRFVYQDYLALFRDEQPPEDHQ